MPANPTTPDTLDLQLSNLFDRHGAAAILSSLADRLRDESGVAAGEGRAEDARRWARLAEEIEQIEC
jgi:hypothetical protein